MSGQAAGGPALRPFLAVDSYLRFFFYFSPHFLEMECVEKCETNNTVESEEMFKRRIPLVSLMHVSFILFPTL